LGLSEQRAWTAGVSVKVSF